MEHYLAEGDLAEAQNKKKDEWVSELLEGFIGLLKERGDELEKVVEDLKKKFGKESKDEAE